MLLSKEKIIANLSSPTQQILGEVNCFELVDSTNRWLLDRSSTDDIHASACIADSQTDGVGRGGKSWHASEQKNVLMSVGYKFDLKLAQLASLSLVVGIAIVNALESLKISGLSLKWPNDVYLNQAKLAGTLIQTQRHPVSGHWTVIGIGLNVEVDPQDKLNIEQPIAELSDLGFNVDHRELIIARLIDELLSAFAKFNQNGFKSFLQRWDELDYLKNQPVVLLQSDRQIEGQYLGVNADGSLRIALQNGEVAEYYVGELSIRKDSGK